MSTAERLTSWERYQALLSNLPPDLTGKRNYALACRAVWAGWMCTRRPGHGGRHAAGNGRVIVAVWPEPEWPESEWSLPLYRTEAGYPRCATCDGGGCPDCTEVEA